MKFVFFGYDFFIESLERLLDDGHELLAIYSCPCDNKRWTFNTRVKAIAKRLHIPYNDQAPKTEDIMALKKHGCDLLISAAYPFKIPTGREVPDGVNIHSSLLPEGRGPLPITHVILHGKKRTGITIHKLTEKWDSGAIISQKAFTVSPNEHFDSLCARLQMLAPDMISTVCADLKGALKKAQPQEEGSYWKMPTKKDRTINWNASVIEIDRTARAFWKLGVLADFDKKTWRIDDVITWKEKHRLPVGSIAHRTPFEIVIAAKDGFVCIRHFERFTEWKVKPS